MEVSRRAAALSRPLTVMLLLAVFSAGAEEEVDLATIHRIKKEAYGRSKVMDTLFHLTDVHGPRLAGSPAYRKSAEWAVERLEDWGADRAGIEEWDQFGRSWSFDRLSLHMTRPVVTPLSAVPMAWCRGTEGPVRAEVVLAPLFPEEEGTDVRFDLRRYKDLIADYAETQRGRLRGKAVLLHAERKLEPAVASPTTRYDDEGLTSLGMAPEPVIHEPYEWPLMKMPADPEERSKAMDGVPLEVSRSFFEERRRVEGELHRFLAEEGTAAVLRVDDRGDGFIVFAEASGSHEVGAPIPPPTLVLAPEQYNRMARLVEKGIPVEIELDLRSDLVDEPVPGRNVIAEIRGRSRPEEIVMLGAHFDSWHGGTGATDNASGSAVAMEVMRILAALDLPIERTVRLALWDGEEQGLRGSRAYVRDHLGDPVTMELKPAHESFYAYFNMDNGGGKIRGVYLQENDMARPIFEAWLAPFEDEGVTTISIRNTGGTDHLSFDAVGLPGFQFIQDPLDYMSRTHHSNMDLYDHVKASDLMQASAVMAAVVHQAATREEPFPRKPLPDPLPPRKE